jgi:hypothetical protein
LNPVYSIPNSKFDLVKVGTKPGGAPLPRLTARVGVAHPSISVTSAYAVRIQGNVNANGALTFEAVSAFGHAHNKVRLRIRRRL